MGETDDAYDLAVIGAGTSGIAASRFYLEVHPSARVVILERDNTVGGVWSSERVYPGFRSQGGIRMAGFSDLEFEPPAEDIDDQGFYMSRNMAAYLEKYVDGHVYDGASLRSRIRFGTAVEGLERTDSGWLIRCSGGGEPVTIPTHKLIVASGSTSVPNMPVLEGKEIFGGPIVHTLDYGRSKIYERKDLQSIAVIGGGKSAADMAYENVKAGRNVKWIIRKSGKGPGSFLGAKVKFGAIMNAAEIGVSRLFLSIMVLPGLQKASLWQRFIYNTTLGAWVLKKLGETLQNQFLATPRYDDRPGAKESFKLLKTEMNGLALDVPAGGVHHDDFWDTIAQSVEVFREDIDHLEQGKIVFTNGTSTDADGILCGTGFRNDVPYLTAEQNVQLGLPHERSTEPPEVQKEWAEREAVAEKAVRERFYKITPPPAPRATDKLGDISATETPFRLYNCMAPLDQSLDHSIAFIGFSTVTNMFANSEFSAIWVTGYLDGTLKLPSPEEQKNDVAYTTTYMRIRCPTYGRLGSWYAFDFFPHFDRMMEEAGLSGHRRSWWKDQMHPLLVKDLRGLKDEYIAKHGDGVAVTSSVRN